MSTSSSDFEMTQMRIRNAAEEAFNMAVHLIRSLGYEIDDRQVDEVLLAVACGEHTLFDSPEEESRKMAAQDPSVSPERLAEIADTLRQHRQQIDDVNRLAAVRVVQSRRAAPPPSE
jgi:siroheme synthase